MAVCLLYVQIALADLAVSRERTSLPLRLRYTKRCGQARPLPPTLFTILLIIASQAFHKR